MSPAFSSATCHSLTFWCVSSASPSLWYTHWWTTGCLAPCYADWCRLSSVCLWPCLCCRWCSSPWRGISSSLTRPGGSQPYIRPTWHLFSFGFWPASLPHLSWPFRFLQMSPTLMLCQSYRSLHSISKLPWRLISMHLLLHLFPTLPKTHLRVTIFTPPSFLTSPVLHTWRPV